MTSYIGIHTNIQGTEVQALDKTGDPAHPPAFDPKSTFLSDDPDDFVLRCRPMYPDVNLSVIVRLPLSGTVGIES